MYFHLIWIKEQNWKQYELDLLIQWWEEDFVRKFLSNRWVVVVSLRPHKEDPKNFWNLKILVSFENVDIEILTSWDKIQESTYLYMSLWLVPHFINFIDNPIPEPEMQNVIKSTLVQIQEEWEKIKQEQEEKKLKEQKKYAESAIDDSLKIINSEIDYIEQILKAWEWVISPMDRKKLEDLMNEMKKIRLGTNFNKMVSLVLYTHNLTKKLEGEILSKYESQKFLIDKNSVATNIDFISELSNSRRISEKAILQPNSMTTQESFHNIIGINSVFVRLIAKDLLHTFEQSSFDDYFAAVMHFLEYITLITILIVSLFRLLWPIFWANSFSLYLLPILGRLGLLLFLFNNLKLKWFILKIVGFVVLSIIYRVGLTLLHWTFSI